MPDTVNALLRVSIAALLFLLGVGFSVMMRSMRLQDLEELETTSTTPTPISWRDVDRDLRVAEIDNALTKAQRLSQVTPNDYTGHGS